MISPIENFTFKIENNKLQRIFHPKKYTIIYKKKQ